MQPSIQSTATQHRRDIRLPLEQGPRQLDIAAKIVRGHKGRRHDLGVTHLALSVFNALHRFEHVVTKTVYSYDLGVHELLLFG